MTARSAAHWTLAFALLAWMSAAPPAGARIVDFPDVAQSASQRSGDAAMADHSNVSPKTASNGLQMVGNFTYSISGSSVTLTVDRIQNASGSRTTGTLRLELWATTTAPAREAAFSGYRLAVSSTFSPLSPSTFYSNATRTASFAPPPDGTYWLVLVLSEFSNSCPAADNYCITDSGVFPSQRTFGGSSVLMVGNFSYQTSGSNVTMSVERIENNSGSTTTGTLRLELWATTQQPERGAGFTGYQLAISNTLSPLPPNTYYSNVVRNTTWTSPPNGTYWMVMVLSEFDPSCPASDHFCIADSALFFEPQVFGTPSPLEANIIEYYHAGFDHYFVTGILDEIYKLDTGVFAGWSRTGYAFKAYVLPGMPGGTSAVCRFFSTAFGVRSSHFYTPSASECQTVKGNPAWQFEAEVAAIAGPVGPVVGSRTCPANYIALYRLYNNGKDGAPNHRYTTNLAVFNQMRSIGWVFEGEGNTFVFACVPP